MIPALSVRAASLVAVTKKKVTIVALEDLGRVSCF